VRAVDGSLSIGGIENIPCASSGTERSNNYQPVPYEPGSEGYLRTISKLDGSFDGANLTVDYAYGNE
jgi:hypothetical protein